MKLASDKRFFCQESVEFLENVVSGAGIQTDPDKIEHIKNWPRPSNSDELRSFVAFAGYFCCLIEDFSKLTKLLTGHLPPTTNKKISKQLKNRKREKNRRIL